MPEQFPNTPFRIFLLKAKRYRNMIIYFLFIFRLHKKKKRLSLILYRL